MEPGRKTSKNYRYKIIRLDMEEAYNPFLPGSNSFLK